MKRCIKCQQEKNFSEFHRQLSKPDGFRSVCKQCRRIETHVYRQEHKQELVEKSRQYRIKNPDFNSNYYKSNPEYFESYRNEKRDHYAEWRKKNRKKLNLYLRNKRANDPIFKLLSCLRSRVSTLVRRSSKYKGSLTKDLLGCSMDDFRKYLENMFENGMSWDNYGDWHIDHIKPCSSFDLNKTGEQEKCFHYSNLQPLWAVDNLRKGNR